MAKKTINKELTGAQDLYNFLFEACNIIRGPVSQDNFKDYITPLLYYKRISDVYDEETEEALREPAYQIGDAVHNVLERTPPELAADISDRGIVLTGGGSLIQGLEELIEEKTGINTMTAEDPLTAVAIGTGKYIEYLADDDKKSKNK